MDCPGYEIAIEKRLRGELSERDAEQLRLHLTSCNSCQSFQNFVQDMEETMTTHTTNAMEQLDWAAISARIDRWKHHLRASLWRGVAAGLLTVPFLVAVSPEWGIVDAILFALAALLPVFFLGRRRQQQSLEQLEQADSSPDELLVVYRHQLDREIAQKRQDSWTIFLIALLPLALLDPSNTTNIAAVGALVAMVVALGLWVRFSVLPRLLRHREALG